MKTERGSEVSYQVAMDKIMPVHANRHAETPDVTSRQDGFRSSLPEWVHRSDQDLLRFLFVCPQPCPELDELMNDARQITAR
jgi:hypothetical protein